ncbi:pentatricopeptide repeat-containing protein At1g09900-like [Panicum virgatum]|uniref:pentatricopeptide repeat-containing protein At1g09900-like n=1 Tax=Panicum virgatum TaxID=38727 RepID=UPI0019D5619B|nr:pentatricopeptide repeat-containing protein At1g09900-like [Panicum virgatum]
MKHPPIAAGTTCSPSHPAAAVSAHPFPPTSHKPQRARIRLAAAAATSRWVKPRAPALPPRRGAGGGGGGGGANQRLHHLVRLGDLDAALLLVESMRDPDRPAVVPCTLLIKKLCAAGRLDDAERVLGASERAGTADAVARYTLVAGYCRAGGRLADAERMLSSLAASGAADVVTYNTLVAGYCREGRLGDARRLVAGMPLAPNSYTNSTLLKGLCSAKEWDDAEELVAEMIRSGCPPNDLTFGMMIHSLCQNGLVDRAMGILDQMSKCGCMRGVIVYNEIISCLAELGRVEEALDLFNSMPCKPDIFSYNAAIKGLCRGEHWEDAGKLITEMVRKDCPPDEVTFDTVISF